jgi:hypothetical protein
MIVAHIQASINMLETRHTDPEMHIIGLEIMRRENVADKELYMSMSLVQLSSGKRMCIYIFMQVLPVFGEVCETAGSKRILS